jgi:GNAT superfamily N-acetyltransferase
MIENARMSEFTIVPYESAHLPGVVALSLTAWAPVFASIERAMEPAAYRHLHPDWRVTQRRAVEEACTSSAMQTWVAIAEAAPIGFVVAKYHADAAMGEIYMVAVDPASQRRGVAIAFMTVAADVLKRRGAAVLMVDTGGDPGHEPARRTYERAGFRALPVVRYFRML